MSTADIAFSLQFDTVMETNEANDDEDAIEPVSGKSSLRALEEVRRCVM